MLVIWVPLQFSEDQLDKSITVIYFDLYIDMNFLVDMILNFFVAYYEKSGKIVDDRVKIILN